MNIEIISIGDELLIGQVVNTNAAWMGVQLNNAGFNVTRVLAIGDDGETIKDSITDSLKRVSVVLLTGGLGPTRDDITKGILCELFNTHLVFSQAVYDNVCNFLKGRVSSINSLNHSQAMVPENCTIIPNLVGTAPIMWFEHNNKIVVAMPGVPSEMKMAMEQSIIPLLKQQFSTGYIIHRTIHVYGIPESVLAEEISRWEDSVPSHIKVAYLPQPGKVRLRLTAKGAIEEVLKQEIDALVNNLNDIIGDNIFGFDDNLPEKNIGELLKTKNQTLVVAESCSGGAIAAKITSIPGCSSYFKGGLVAYSNELKQTILNVSSQTLLTYGAVSQQVVEEMALGAKAVLKSDWSISVSGIAGPGGAMPNKPVGTIWIAVAKPNNKVISQMFSFGLFRERNILQTVDAALIMFYKELMAQKLEE